MDELVIKTLSRNNFKKYLKDIVYIGRIQLRRFEKWDENNFLVSLPLKFKLSSCVFFRGKLIGYCIASKRKNITRIHRIAVIPECVGRGVGHLMIKFLKQKARKYNCDKIIAETLKNIKSNKFYQKEGFERLNSIRQKDYSLIKKTEIRQRFMEKSCVFESKI